MIKVKDVMKKHVITADPNMSMSTIAKILTNNKIGCVVLLENNKPIGIVTTNDIVSLVAKEQNLKKIKAGEYWKSLKRPFITISPNESLFKVAKKMIKTGYKRLPVVENNELKGIISTKEVLMVSPELIEILSERLKARAELVARPEQIISGICEICGEYSDNLRNVSGRWICPECKDIES
ncbi:MAG: CBS domain-containing protein [Candidatus Aenigmatarchaeota archaeon]